MENTIGLYLHIPFCRRACFYCHFVKYPYRQAALSEYIGLLKEEIRLRSLRVDGRKVDTIYFGGGSPSLLEAGETESILKVIATHFPMAPEPEISMEMNPEDCDGDKLAALKNMGFSRLSLGVQSFSENDLAFLKRNHSSRMAVDCIERALRLGFPSISLDFMIGLPTQTFPSLKNNITRLHQYRIPHVSVYLLEGVKNQRVNERRDHDHYYYIKCALEAAAYRHYEISNYARENHQCRHNLKYWQDNEYIGIGVSASGYENREDYQNVSTTAQYRRYLTDKQLPVGQRHRYRKSIRRIITGLRLTGGIPIGMLRHYPRERELLIAEKYLEVAGNRIFIAPDKLLLLNEILTYFI